MPLQPFDSSFNQFNPHALPLLAALLAVLVWAIRIARLDHSSRIRPRVFVLTLAIAWWLAAFSALYLSANEMIALGWAKLGYLGLSFVPPSFYHLAVTMLGIASQRLGIVYAAWSLSGLFSILAATTELIVAAVEPNWWGYHPTLGSLGPLYFLFFITLTGATLLEYFSALHRVGSEQPREMLRALLLAGGVASLAIADFLPAFGVSIYPAGYLSITVALYIAGRVIARHGVVASQAVKSDTRVLAALEEIRQHMNVIISNTPIILFSVDQSGRFELAEGKGLAILGLEPGDLVGQSVYDVHDTMPQFAIGLRRALRGESFSIPMQVGEFMFDSWWLPRYDGAGRVMGMTGIAMDISRRHQVEQALSRSEEQHLYDGLHDGLTGLPNRVLFLDRLGHTVRRAERQPDAYFAVLYVDFDQFKLVNDSLGHAAGDTLLREIALRLERHLRPGDTVARLGGDEFVLLLDDMENAGDAIMVARRFQEELARPYYLDDNELFVSASIGIALNSDSYQHPGDLLRDADIAMHRAKASGRGQYAVFDMTMHAAAVARLQMETYLRHAMARGELMLVYQPIVSISSGRTVGFEALVRWRHPSLGLIGPEHFISIAEETGLIEPIGQWVLLNACNQARQWQARYPEAPPWTMSVNLSARQFIQPDLVEQVRAILSETGYDPGSLKLEITESVLMHNAESASLVLEQLRALGIQLHIDDFGTGYSSLSYLHQFPLDSLKIDRSFVRRMGPGGDGATIIQTIVALARNLGMKVVAEGVENAEQLSQLRHLGCHYGQGFLFAPPREPEEAVAFLQGTESAAASQDSSSSDV